MDRPPRPKPHPNAKKVPKFAPLKLEDSEPITRVDLQYDLLTCIFEDQHKVFTDPNGTPPLSKVCFRDLYINAILKSSRASRFLRDKMGDVPRFANDFAMLSLLINVNRIPTNMAFFTEMKTTLRTYHPIPVLQGTNGNLQDVPRIRLILKATNLSEESEVPLNPAQLLDRTFEGHIPSTGITNLLFILANYSPNISENHNFPDNFDFLDMFMPAPYSSESRARAFLYLCYFYLERPGRQDNPFDDPNCNANQIPPLVPLTPEEIVLENVQTEAEVELAQTLLKQRTDFVHSQEELGEKAGPSGTKGIKAAGRQSTDEDLTSKRKRPGEGSSKDTAGKRKQKGAAEPDQVALPGGSSTGRILPVEGPPLRTKMWHPKPQHHHIPPPRLSRTPEPRMSTQQDTSATGGAPQYATRDANLHLAASTTNSMELLRRSSGGTLQYAFDAATQSDPLQDSDEDPADQQRRQEYEQRLAVLNRLPW